MLAVYQGIHDQFTRGDDLPVHGVYRGLQMAMQYFAAQHPEYDFFWEWEHDVRYTGHYLDLVTKLADWARRQPRKERDGNRGDRQERGERAPKRAERPERTAEPAAEKPARTRRPRKSADDADRSGGNGGIDSSILPPSIRGDDAGGDGGTLETVE